MNWKVKYWILATGLGFVIVDSLMTNWLMTHGVTEMNPLMAPIAGTVWLPVVKIGWVAVFILLIALISRRKAKREQPSQS